MMPISNRVEAVGESPEETKEWEAIAKFVARGKGSAVKDKGKKVMSTYDRLPKSNPTIHEIEVNGTRYAIVKIISLSN
jgi:hypothetical protein